MGETADMANTSTRIHRNLDRIRQQVRTLEDRYRHVTGSTRIIAVSKSRSIDEILAAVHYRQTDFGESYVQEAVDKIVRLYDLGLTWHFIGPIQKNKTRLIAQHFDWVHGIDRPVIASRLDAQRPEHMTPINVCVQINIDQEKTKAGIAFADLPELARHIRNLPHLRLRGLMAIPARTSSFKLQYAAFIRMQSFLEKLRDNEYEPDTLSMGMSNDFEAAIAAGSNMVRIGTSIFGPRT